jgi:hypothetical protein
MPVDARRGASQSDELQAAHRGGLFFSFCVISILDLDEKTPLAHLENASGAPLRLARGALPANRLNCLLKTFGWPLRGILVQRLPQFCRMIRPWNGNHMAVS